MDAGVHRDGTTAAERLGENLQQRHDNAPAGPDQKGCRTCGVVSEADLGANYLCNHIIVIDHSPGKRQLPPGQNLAHRTTHPTGPRANSNSRFGFEVQDAILRHFLPGDAPRGGLSNRAILADSNSKLTNRELAGLRASPHIHCPSLSDRKTP